MINLAVVCHSARPHITVTARKVVGGWCPPARFRFLLRSGRLQRACVRACSRGAQVPSYLCRHRSRPYYCVGLPRCHGSRPHADGHQCTDIPYVRADESYFGTRGRVRCACAHSAYAVCSVLHADPRTFDDRYLSFSNAGLNGTIVSAIGGLENLRCVNDNVLRNFRRLHNRRQYWGPGLGPLPSHN